MSRAAVSARKAERKLAQKTAANEAFFAMAEYSYATDQSVVRCDSCNLLQVTWPTFIKSDAGCFMCGHATGTSA
jgi:hypothetical protein